VWTTRRLARYAAALLTVVGSAFVPAAESAPAVAAASDLKFALEEIAGHFRTDSGRDVRLTFGSSGNLARQIEQGAPFELFLSADEDLVFGLADKGLTRDRGALYAIGRIVLFVPAGSSIAPDPDLEGLRRALVAGQVNHFAIANPEHAPYGRAAEQALRRAGLWPRLQGRLVLGENVSQAAQFAVGGDTEGGIIAYSLALAPTMASRGRFALLPETWHAPLRQRMVLMKGATADGASFYTYLQGPVARAIMERHGFMLPGQ